MLEAWKQIARGKTLMRALMNQALAGFTLSGAVLDIGGGKNPSYFGYFKGVGESSIINLDKQYGQGKNAEIDFERDRLPFEDGRFDQALMLNVLEHVYNHRFLLVEAHRVLKQEGQVIGFVPFLINYHADPHDYFRYTDEALAKVFTEAGFKTLEIRPIGRGPFAVNFNTLASFSPRVVNAIVLPFYWFLDTLILALKPAMRKRFSLGYMFVLTK